MKKLLLLLLILFLPIIGNSQTDDEFQSAYSLFDNKNYDQALNIIDDLLLKYPQSAHLYFLKGYAFTNKENLYNAKINYKKAIELNKDHFGVYGRLASIYFTEENYKDAIPLYEKHGSLNDDIEKSFAEFNIAACYTRLKNYEEAIKHSTNVISLKANEEQVALSYWNRGLHKNSISKNSGCNDLNEGYDRFMSASKQNEEWGFKNLNTDFMYNSYCDSKEVNNLRFKLHKMEIKRYYKVRLDKIKEQNKNK
jgi:tetratricopeptide (TPR) repeat protein